MKAWLRQHRYALAITLRRLAAQPFSSLANLLVMALALALPLLGSAILVSVQPLARQVSVTPELTVFMQTQAPATAAGAVAERIGRDYASQI
ncbi:ABC transporter permease, partial [Bordetella pertussis]